MYQKAVYADLCNLGMKTSLRCGKQLDISSLKSRLARRRIGKAENSTPRHFSSPPKKTKLELVRQQAESSDNKCESNVQRHRRQWWQRTKLHTSAAITFDQCTYFDVRPFCRGTWYASASRTLERRRPLRVIAEVKWSSCPRLLFP